MAGTVALTEEAVRTYLDGEIKRWREMRDSMAGYEKTREAKAQIRGLQDMRINFLGEMLPPMRGKEAGS